MYTNRGKNQKFVFGGQFEIFILKIALLITNFSRANYGVNLKFTIQKGLQLSTID